MTKDFDILLEKINNKKAIIGMVGIGYVGKNEGIYIAKAGYKTIGFDISEKNIDVVNELNLNNFSATKDFESLKECDIIFISVPTPINSAFKPDLTSVKAATNTVCEHLKKGQLIIFESTVAPGTTKEVVLPILEKSNLKVEQDFFLAYSPERIDIGNEKYTFQTTPKVVAGFSKDSKELTKTFYSYIIDQVVDVSTLEAAELCKIMENTVRFVNINLMNEFSKYGAARHINIFEVVKAAATKPFGYFPYFPGAGISGHCIPVDPFYLLDDGKKLDIDFELIETCMNSHKKRMKSIAQKAVFLSNKKNPNILIIGVAIKPDCDDARESAAVKIMKHIEDDGASVFYHDPYIEEIDGYKSNDLTDEFLSKIDCIVIVTDHKNIDYDKLLKLNKPIIDPKNVYKDEKNIIRV
jgi:UDP-N-acetyl-D-glucosamine dehydrogenase